MAIISILASILFPVFSKAMDKARATACLSNVVQIQMATMMYATDYDSCYPPEAYVPSDGTPAGVPVTWASAPTGPIVNNKPKYEGMIYPYMQNVQILLCPGLPGTPVGYALNWWIVGAGGANAQKSAQKITYMDATTTTSLYPMQWYAYPNGMADPDSTFNSGVIPSARHMEGANFAYADGHAKWSRVELFAAASGTDNNFINSWNPAT